MDLLDPTILDEASVTAILLSLRVAAVATLANLPLALAISWLLARRAFPGKAVVSALVHLPLVLPPVVTGYLLLLAFGRQGIFGAFLADTFNITFAFRWTGAALAAAVMSLPLMVRAMRQSFEAIDPRYSEAASTLGAPRLSVFLSIHLPLILPGMIAGVVMGFAKALGEFGATITFVAAIPGETETLPAAIYTLLQIPGSEARAATLAVYAALLAIGAVIVSEWLARRASRRIGGT